MKIENSREEICELIDKLTIDMFELIEEKIQCELKIENGTKEGQMHMAKTRFIKGSNYVSKSQLPTENGNFIEPLVTISEHKDELNANKLELELHTIDKENNFVDPLRWFGILVPESLQQARTKYQQCLHYVIECANTQLKLHNTLVNIKKLLNIKNNIV